MLELIVSLLIARSDYFFLTPLSKVEVERLITSRVTIANDPVIYPQEITQILRVQPECTRNRENKQYQCTWTEGERQIQGYWSEGWKFQRWESRGF